MRNIERRLATLAHIYGCPRHGEMLTCPTCDPHPPMPGWARDGIDTFMDGLLARLTPEEIRLAMSRVSPRPTMDHCPRCHDVRVCGSCIERYGRELFKAMGLTETEDAALRALTSKVRAFQQG